MAAIWDYIAFNNLDAADRFLDAAEDAFDQLAKSPGTGRARIFRDPTLQGMRSFRIKSFDNYLRPGQCRHANPVGKYRVQFQLAGDVPDIVLISSKIDVATGKRRVWTQLWLGFQKIFRQ